jgi:hypothetical protein
MMTAILVAPAGAAAAVNGALGAGSVVAALPAWARALTPSPDASMQTSVNERFMEIRNSFGSWVWSPAFLCGSELFASWLSHLMRFVEATSPAGNQKCRAETRTEDILRNSSEL